MALSFVHGKCQHYYESGHPRAAPAEEDLRGLDTLQRNGHAKWKAVDQ
jgi:hypothetical protein